MKVTTHKERRSFTLDRELVSYLELVRAELKTSSTSSALEEILRRSKSQHERQKVQSAMVDYYDSLSERDREENRAWGAFAESQLRED